MAKKRKKGKPRRRQRDNRSITNSRRMLSSRFILKDIDHEKDYRRDSIMSDRRSWVPALHTVRDRTVDGRLVSYTLTKPKKKRVDSINDRISFADPRRTLVCIRRKRRRRSLFASGGIGSGKRVTRFRRRNENSDIKC